MFVCVARVRSLLSNWQWDHMLSVDRHTLELHWLLLTIYDVNVTTATTRYGAELHERNAGNTYAAKPRSGGAGTKISNSK